MRVAHHSNNRHLVWFRKQSEPNWVLAGKEASGQRFIDDYDFRSLYAILGGEQSSGAYRYAHRLEVVRTDAIHTHNRLFSPLIGTPIDPKWPQQEGPGERKEISQAGGSNSWQRLDMREKLLEISDALRRCRRVFGATGRERERQYAIRIETLGNGQQAQEALDHQPRANE